MYGTIYFSLFIMANVLFHFDVFNLHYTVLAPHKKELNHYAFFYFEHKKYVNKIVNGAQRICARMVAIPHFELFVTFHFDHSLMSKRITGSNLDRIK